MNPGTGGSTLLFQLPKTMLNDISREWRKKALQSDMCKRVVVRVELCWETFLLFWHPTPQIRLNPIRANNRQPPLHVKSASQHVILHVRAHGCAMPLRDDGRSSLRQYAVLWF